MTRRPIPPYLRVVDEPTAEAEPCRVIVPALAGSNGIVAARYLQPYVDAGRDIIEAAVAAIVGEAARHGFGGRLWEPDAVRDGIREIVAQIVHHAVILELTGGEES
jgi:hypothetical protein